MSNETEEWAPKTREDWVGLFGDGFKTALTTIRSEKEEEDAKNQNNNNGKDSDDDSKPAKRSFADKLLGL